jgi:hypothetical protein
MFTAVKTVDVRGTSLYPTLEKSERIVLSPWLRASVNALNATATQNSFQTSPNAARELLEVRRPETAGAGGVGIRVRLKAETRTKQAENEIKVYEKV